MKSKPIKSRNLRFIDELKERILTEYLHVLTRINIKKWISKKVNEQGEIVGFLISYVQLIAHARKITGVLYSKGKQHVDTRQPTNNQRTT